MHRAPNPQGFAPPVRFGSPLSLPERSPCAVAASAAATLPLAAASSASSRLISAFTRLWRPRIASAMVCVCVPRQFALSDIFPESCLAVHYLQLIPLPPFQLVLPVWSLLLLLRFEPAAPAPARRGRARDISPRRSAAGGFRRLARSSSCRCAQQVARFPHLSCQTRPRCMSDEITITKAPRLPTRPAPRACGAARPSPSRKAILLAQASTARSPTTAGSGCGLVTHTRRSYSPPPAPPPPCAGGASALRQSNTCIADSISHDDAALHRARSGPRSSAGATRARCVSETDSLTTGQGQSNI